jgi:RNA polymerase sigma factor (sigma-70 family)
MTPPADLDLLNRTAQGDREAFGELVARHQSLVCAVAYSIVGDLAGSEDVAQEAFVAAWKQLGQLHDLTKFKSWLCGITRNLAFLAVRREHKSEPLDARSSPADAQPTPEERAVTREEQALVWSALEALPETYREPLILFYRDEESVARVADALELSQDAVKQRLARGREMLRVEVAATVEKALRRSGPGAIFTLAVLGALPGVGAASASAATIGAAGKAAGPLATAAVNAGLTGALVGSLGGIAGGSLGAWASWKTARYQRERDLYRTSLIIYAVGLVIFLLPFVAMGLGWKPWAWGMTTYAIGFAIWMTVFFGASGVWIWYLIRRWRKIVAEEVAAGTPTLPQTQLHRQLARWEGRQWASPWSLFGWPLVHINFASPTMHPADAAQGGRKSKIARGWIAIGDRAYGIILAVGGIATGGIAIGGVSMGGIAFGGAAFGLVGIGGFGAGLFAFGGGAIGVFAVGGLALGWLALGGLALAIRGAHGGLALAFQFATGALAIAEHANDDAAKAFVKQSLFFRTGEWLLAVMPPIQQSFWFNFACVAGSVLISIGFWPLAYRRVNQK